MRHLDLGESFKGNFEVRSPWRVGQSETIQLSVKIILPIYKEGMHEQ